MEDMLDEHALSVWVFWFYCMTQCNNTLQQLLSVFVWARADSQWQEMPDRKFNGYGVMDIWIFLSYTV